MRLNVTIYGLCVYLIMSFQPRLHALMSRSNQELQKCYTLSERIWDWIDDHSILVRRLPANKDLVFVKRDLITSKETVLFKLSPTDYRHYDRIHAYLSSHCCPK